MSTAYLCCVVSIVSLYFVSVKADCSSFPADIDHASHNISSPAPFPEGTVAQFSCDDGYVSDGNTLYTTCSNSQWTISGEISCGQVFCGHVDTPQNGYLVNSPTYEVASTMEFSCNEGYDINGVSSLFCRIDGEWNPSSAPTCTIKDCGEFGDVANGETFQDNSNVDRNKYGSVVQVTCNNGYVLNGQPEVRCQANGEWEPKPTCEVTSCDPYPGLNGQCVKDSSYSNNLLFLVCKDDYNVSGLKQGPMYARCSNNEWDNTGMACLCNCKIPVVSSNTVVISNLNDKNFLLHGQFLDWSCLGGTIKEMSGDETVSCNNGDIKVKTSNGELIADNLRDSDLCVSKSRMEIENDKRVNNSECVVGVNILVVFIFLLHIL